MAYYYTTDVASMSTRRIELEIDWHYNLQGYRELHPDDIARLLELEEEYEKRLAE
jgi:hypothetical protein